jgi:tRNA (guanine-N7-)-methyltransferase
MPHILLEQHQNITTNDIFPFVAKGVHDDKIAVKLDNKEFLLTRVEKNNNILIKLDNPTRLSPVSLMKDALNKYAKYTNSKILFSNTNSIYNRVKPQDKYLKDIRYFIDQFNTTKEIWVEVGFGSGVHLLHQAKQNQDKLIIGLEIHSASIEQVLKQLKIQNITNVLIVNYDARLFLEFLQSNSVGRIFVHFPVPWDKKPHRRVISKEFIEESLRVLKVNGTLELRTDSQNYFEYTKELLKDFKEYPNSILENQDLEVTSKYEARWKRQNKTIWDIKIISTNNSQNNILKANFGFENITLSSIKTNLPTKPLIYDKYFVHFEAIYDIISHEKKDQVLLKVTFGDFNRPITKYIIVGQNESRYFQEPPIKTKANLKAHKKILEILQ